MKHCFKYFKNTDCEYFPCHNVKDTSTFNCLFCFCQLYRIKDCGGFYHILENGKKDCSKCIIPHQPQNYDYIIARLSKIK